jgi:hypothetical protein
MVAVDNEEINIELRDHQKGIGDWNKRSLAKNLHEWAERFASEFKLKISVPALMLDRLKRTCYGRFRRGRNGFGLLNEIAINEAYISRERYWDTLVTLLHELLHAEQESVGRPGKGNYHNKAFRTKAGTLGLIVDQWGHTLVAPSPSPFWNLLQKYGIEVPEIVEPTPVAVAKPGNSKLKLWVCSCQPEPVRVRVAIVDFRAKCLKCDQLFVRKS